MYTLQTFPLSFSRTRCKETPRNGTSPRVKNRKAAWISSRWYILNGSGITSPFAMPSFTIAFSSNAWRIAQGWVKLELRNMHMHMSIHECSSVFMHTFALGTPEGVSLRTWSRRTLTYFTPLNIARIGSVVPTTISNFPISNNVPSVAKHRTLACSSSWLLLVNSNCLKQLLSKYLMRVQSYDPVVNAWVAWCRVRRVGTQNLTP